jgi:hypothetical protein
MFYCSDTGFLVTRDADESWNSDCNQLTSGLGLQGELLSRLVSTLRMQPSRFILAIIKSIYPLGSEVFLFSVISRSALRPTQHRRVVLIAVTLPGHEADLSPPPTAEVKITWIYTPTLPISLSSEMWCRVLRQKFHRCFGRTYCLHLQCRRVSEAINQLGTHNERNLYWVWVSYSCNHNVYYLLGSDALCFLRASLTLLP